MTIRFKYGTAAVAMFWSGLAVAQVPPKPAPAPTPSGVAGAAPASTSGFAPPTDPAAPPAPVGEPPPAERAPPPVAPESAQAATADQDEAVVEQPKKKKKKRKKKKRRQLVDEEQSEAEPSEEDEQDAAEAELKPRRRQGWSLRGTRFVVSAERVTSLLTWSQKLSDEVVNFNTGARSTVELEQAGTDVAFLGASPIGENAFARNPFALPRLGFDGVFPNGLTLGGSISYVVSSGETSAPDSFGGTTKRDRPTESIFLVAPRLGVLIPTSAKVGVWLRGGITRVQAVTQVRTVDEFGSSTDEVTLTYVDVTLEPQLVFTPVPHVGITLGAALDIGVTGSAEDNSTSTTTEPDFSGSSYGVTAGISAFF